MAEDAAQDMAEPTLPITSVPAPTAAGNPPPASSMSAQLARLGWLCTAASGLILAGVLGGNAMLLLAGTAPALWLIALVDIGPLIALLLGNVGTILGYYGTWRILRRLDEYSVRDDAKNQLMQVPGMVQDLPHALSRRFGCVHVVTLGTLAVSLVVTGLTLAPPPLRALGVAVVVATPTPTPTAPPTPIPSPTATAIPALSVLVSPLNAQQQCAADGTLQPLTVTLDNTGSAVDVLWSLTISDTVPNTTLAWATANPATGTVPAGTTSTFALVPTSRLCYAAKQPASYTAHITLDNGALALFTFTDTITPPAAPAIFAATQNQDTQQSCIHGTTTYVPAYDITLSNQLPNTTVVWSIGSFDLNANGSPWASAAPQRGVLTPGATGTITITPSTIACQIATTTTWRARITTDQGTTITITDTVAP